MPLLSKWHASAKPCQNKALKNWLAERYSWIPKADIFKAPDEKMILLDMTHHHFVLSFPSSRMCGLLICFSTCFWDKGGHEHIFCTGRRGTDCPDRGTFLAYQDISTGNSYWNPSIGCQELGLKVWINVMSPKPLSPQDGDMVTWWAAEAIALAKRQAGPCWVTFWKVTHCTMMHHDTTFLRLFMTGWWFGTFGWFFH